jgi:uncharacterized protein (TIGR02001 family)
MNKKLLPLVSILATVLTGANAQTTAAPAPTTAPGVSITATGSVVSNYMFRGLRLGTAAFQPSVEAVSGDLTLGVWGSVPFDAGDVPDSSDPEIDLYGSYNFALSKEATLTPGFTLYWYPDAPTSAGFYTTTFEPNIAFSYTFEGVKLTPKVYWDTVLDGATYEFTAAYAVPLKDIGAELNFTATAGTYKWKDASNKTTPDVKAWGDYWLLGVSAPFQIAPNQKLTVGFAYTEGRRAFTKQGTLPRSNNSLAVGRGVVSVSYAFTF